MAEKMSLQQVRDQIAAVATEDDYMLQGWIAALDAHLTQPAQAVDVVYDGALNDACWAFSESMPVPLPGPIFNNVKTALKAAIEKWLSTRALAGEKAEGSVVVGYCHRDEAERLMDRKDQPKHTFTAIEVWNKRSDFYRIPVLLTLPTPPTDGEG